MDVPVRGRCDDAAVLAGGRARNRARLEPVEAERIVRAVGLAELVREHALPAHLPRRKTLLVHSIKR